MSTLGYSTWGASFGSSWGGSWGYRSTGGKGDNEQPAIYKPSGLLDRPVRKKITKAIAKVQQRVEESGQIGKEVVAEAKEEFFGTEQVEALLPKESMSSAQVDAEIKRLLHRKIQIEEDENLVILLMAASS